MEALESLQVSEMVVDHVAVVVVLLEVVVVQRELFPLSLLVLLQVHRRIRADHFRIINVGQLEMLMTCDAARAAVYF